MENRPRMGVAEFLRGYPLAGRYTSGRLIGASMEKTEAFDPVRRLAWTILQQIERSSGFADLILDRAFSKAPELRPLDRAYISEMVLGTLRWQGRLDAIIQRASKSREKKLDPRLLHLLRLGAYQILFMDRVPDSAAVNESVRLAKAVFKNERIAGFVNALLRSIARHKDQEHFPSFQDHPVDHIAQALLPSSLVGGALGHRIWPGDSQKALRSQQSKASLHGPDQHAKNFPGRALGEQFNALGISSLPTQFSPEGLILAKSPFPAEEGLFQKGMYFVQDEASQMIPHLLWPQPGERVLDACAAPGGKTTHLAQLMKDRGEILALDLHGSKIRLIRENCPVWESPSCGATQADAPGPSPFLPMISLTGSSWMRPAPAWASFTAIRRPSGGGSPKISSASRIFKVGLLDNVSSRLKPGGVLVYSTCTMTREENDWVVASFLKSHPEFELEDLRSLSLNSYHSLIDARGYFQTYPEMITRNEDYRMDGFFAARLRKT